MPNALNRFVKFLDKIFLSEPQLICLHTSITILAQSYIVPNIITRIVLFSIKSLVCTQIVSNIAYTNGFICTQMV